MYCYKIFTFVPNVFPIQLCMRKCFQNFVSFPQIMRESRNQNSAADFLSLIQRFQISQNGYASEAVSYKETILIWFADCFCNSFHPLFHFWKIWIRHLRHEY